jgi:beta-N-acetylglucosaminidase
VKKIIPLLLIFLILPLSIKKVPKIGIGISGKIEVENRIEIIKNPLEYDNITTEQLLNYFQIHKEMRKISEYIVEGCKKYNVSVILITAIIVQESSWGESDLARYKQNYFGLGAVDWNPNSAINFLNMDLKDAIIDSIRIIKEDYLYLNDIQKIGKKYCPTDSWSEKIIKIMNNLNEEVNK